MAHDGQKPARYDSKTPPPSFDDGKRRYDKLGEELCSIQAQMASAKIVLDDRDIPWDEPEKKQLKEWHRRATAALMHKQRERSFLKQWVHANQPISRLDPNRDVDRNDAESLLNAAYHVLTSLASEGVELKHNEQGVLDAIRAYFA